jgi:hypothetical protein
MKVKKTVKKAQSGTDTTGLATKKQAVRDMRAKMESAPFDYIREINEKAGRRVDTAARNAAVKRKEFYVDPKSGDLFPVKKKAKFGAKMVKKAIVKKVVKSIKKSAKKK